MGTKTKKKKTKASAKKTQGRPSIKITKEMISTAIQCVKACLSIDGTCARMGIARSTWYLWEEKSKKPRIKANKPYVDFFAMIEKALGDAELKLVLDIQKTKDWKAKMAILKRRFASSWDDEYKDLLSGKETEIEKLKIENDRLLEEIDELVDSGDSEK